MNTDLPHSQLPQPTSSEVGLPDSTSGSEASLFRCTRCEQMLPDSSFYRDRSKPGGRHSHCKQCRAPAARRWRKANRERIAEYNHRYQESNQERVAEAQRRYREANPERVRRWREANPERAAESTRRWREANPDAARRWRESNVDAVRHYHRANRNRRNARLKERRCVDPLFRLISNMRSRLSQAIKAQDASKSAHTFELVGCTYGELWAHLEKQLQPGMVWGNYGKWHVDHIRPCASFDLKDIEQQRQCFHFSNLQPLWARDNESKNDKYEPSAP